MQHLQFQLQTEPLMPAGALGNPGEGQPLKPELYEIVYSDEGNNQKLSEELKKLAASLEQIKSYMSQKDHRIKDKLKQLVRDLLDPIRFLFKGASLQGGRRGSRGPGSLL